MSMRIAELYSELGFRVDFRKLREYEKKLQQVNRNLNESGRRFQTQLQRNNKRTLQGFNAIEKRVNKHRGQLWQMRNDYRRINAEYKQGNISHERRTRMLTEINNQYREQKRHIRGINKEHARSPMGRMRSTAKALNQPVRGSSGVSGGHYRAGATAGLAARFANPAAIGGAAIVGTGMAAQASNREYQRYESVRSGLVALEGGAEAANKRLKELAQMAQYYGQPFMAVGEGFKSLANNLKGTAIEPQTMRIFRSLQEYATAMGLNQQDLSGIQLAVGQIAAAGKLQGDEINQLAERGVSREKLAQAMGMSLEQFMEKQGTQEGILAKDLLPALARVLSEQARAGGALQSRLTSTSAEQNRALNAAVFANIAANTKGLDYYFNEFYQGLQRLVTNAMPLIDEIAEAFKSMAEPTKRNLEAFGEILGSIGLISDSLDGINIESPFIKLNDVLNNLADFLDDIADTVDLLRSDQGWKDKIAGIGDLIGNQLQRVGEMFVNAIIDKVNILLPKAMEISPVSFTTTKANQNMLMMKPEVIEQMRNVAKNSQPLLNQYGGINSPNDLPFGPVRDRQGNTYNVESPVLNIQVDGYNQDPQELVDMIQENWEANMSNTIRSASMNDMSGEK